MVPVLVNWCGALTVEGEQVAAYLNLVGVPVPPVPDGSLLKPAALYLRTLSADEQGRLYWAALEASTLESVGVYGA